MLRKKNVNNIHWFKGEVEKNKIKIPKELKIKRKKEQIWNQNKINGETTFQC
jgi:hypothetical protein